MIIDLLFSGVLNAAAAAVLDSTSVSRANVHIHSIYLYNVYVLYMREPGAHGYIRNVSK